MKKLVIVGLCLWGGLMLPLLATAKSEEDYKQEIQMLKQRNRQLEDKLEQMSADLKRANATAENLQKQFAKMTSDTEKNARDVKEAQEAAKLVKEQLKNCLVQQAASGSQPKKESQESAEQVTQTIKLIQELQNTLKEANTEIEKQKKIVTALKKETAGEKEAALLAELETREAELQRQRKQYKATLELLQDREKELKQAQALSKENAKTPDLEATLAEANAKILELARDNTQLKSQIAEVQRNQQQNRAQAAEIARLEGELRKAAEMINANAKELVALKTTETDLNTQLTRLAEEKTALETRLSEKNAAFTQTVSELKSQVCENQAVPDAAKQRIQELTQELQNVKILLDTQNQIQREYPKLEREAAACRERVGELEKTQGSSQAQSQTLRTQLQETQSALEQAQRELNAVATLNLELRARLQEEASFQQSQVTRITDEKKSSQVTLQQQILQEQMRRKQVETDLIDARKQAEILRQQMASLNEKLMTQEGVITPVRMLPHVSGYEGLSGSIRTLFPKELMQGMSGEEITMLGWAADGSKIAYQKSGPQTAQLIIFNTQTRQVAKLLEWQTSSGSVSRLAWAADHDHFLAAIGSSGKYALYFGRSSGIIGSPVPITDQEAHFAWSPTQLQFAYFSGSTLFVRDLQGGMLPVQLGAMPDAVGTSLQWSPDSTRIALSIKREGSFDILLLLLSGGKPVLQNLAASSSDDIRPSWSPDGKYIAFYVRSAQYDTKIAVIPVDLSRSPYIVAHNTSLPSFGGPLWLSTTELLYVGAEQPSVSQNAIYTVDIMTGRRASAPMSVLLAE